MEAWIVMKKNKGAMEGGKPKEMGEQVPWAHMLLLPSCLFLDPFFSSSLTFLYNFALSLLLIFVCLPSHHKIIIIPK